MTQRLAISRQLQGWCGIVPQAAAAFRDYAAALRELQHGWTHCRSAPVVFYDQLGCGRSDRPSPGPWVTEYFVGEL